jgi:pyruvate-ferredoxin/flavodoxin oxidoreductase
MDGCNAAAHIAYYFSDNAIIYPITPSSPMAEHIDAFSAAGRKNYND